MSIQTVHFMSRADAEKLKGDPRVAVIAIGDPAAWPSNLSPNFAAVHRVEFHDVDTDDSDYYIVFDNTLANGIWDFLDTLPANVDTLVVHCHMGVSRSAAVAKAAAQYFQATYPESYSLYNKRVFSVMQQALRKRQYPDEDTEYH